MSRIKFHCFLSFFVFFVEFPFFKILCPHLLLKMKVKRTVLVFYFGLFLLFDFVVVVFWGDFFFHFFLWGGIFIFIISFLAFKECCDRGRGN